MLPSRYVGKADSVDMTLDGAFWVNSQTIVLGASARAILTFAILVLYNVHAAPAMVLSGVVFAETIS